MYWEATSRHCLANTKQGNYAKNLKTKKNKISRFEQAIGNEVWDPQGQWSQMLNKVRVVEEDIIKIKIQK